jgi:hypothetical protein
LDDGFAHSMQTACFFSMITFLSRPGARRATQVFGRRSSSLPMHGSQCFAHNASGHTKFPDPRLTQDCATDISGAALVTQGGQPSKQTAQGKVASPGGSQPGTDL